MKIRDAGPDTTQRQPAAASSTQQLVRSARGAAATPLDLLQGAVDRSPRVLAQRRALQAAFGSVFQPRGDELEDEALVQARLEGAPVQRAGESPGSSAPSAPSSGATVAPVNETGMPNQLKAGIEALSGMDVSDVRVHRDSGKPARLDALAYAQGNEIHLGPGQEQHLPHEAWHVVQQRQGRVREKMQVGGVGVNDESGLEREADAMGGRAIVQGKRPGGTNETPALPVDTRDPRARNRVETPVLQRLSIPEFAGAHRISSWSALPPTHVYEGQPAASGAYEVPGTRRAVLAAFREGGDAVNTRLSFDLQSVNDARGGIYERSHLIGKLLGGPGDAMNIVPTRAAFNKAQLERIETPIREARKKCNRVFELQVDVQYQGHGNQGLTDIERLLPTSFTYGLSEYLWDGRSPSTAPQNWGLPIALTSETLNHDLSGLAKLPTQSEAVLHGNMAGLADYYARQMNVIPNVSEMAARKAIAQMRRMASTLIADDDEVKNCLPRDVVKTLVGKLTPRMDEVIEGLKKEGATGMLKTQAASEEGKHTAMEEEAHVEDESATQSADDQEMVAETVEAACRLLAECRNIRWRDRSILARSAADLTKLVVALQGAWKDLEALAAERILANISALNMIAMSGENGIRENSVAIGDHIEAIIVGIGEPEEYFD